MILFKLKNLLIHQAYAQTTPILGLPNSGATGTIAVPEAQKTTDLSQVISDQQFFQTEIGVFVSKGMTAIISVAALLCLGYLLWGAIDWLTSEGDKDKYTSARNKILHAIMGLAIVVAVWAVWQLILFFFGLNKVFNL